MPIIGLPAGGVDGTDEPPVVDSMCLLRIVTVVVVVVVVVVFLDARRGLNLLGKSDEVDSKLSLTISFETDDCTARVDVRFMTLLLVVVDTTVVT